MAENEEIQDQKASENADNTSEPQAQAKPKPRVWPAVLLLMGLMVGAASAAVVTASVAIRPAPEASQNDVAAPDAVTEKEPGQPCEFKLDEPLIVNVYQTQQRRYLSVKPVLVLDGKDTMDKIKAKQVELQHLMIGVLKHKTLEQLDDPDAANSIGREVQEMANLKLGIGNGVTSVYFTQFVVQ